MGSTCTSHFTVLKYCGPFSDVQRINRENTLTKPRRPTHAAAKAEMADVIRFFSSSMWEHAAYWRRWQLGVPSMQNQNNEEFQKKA